MDEEIYDRLLHGRKLQLLPEDKDSVIRIIMNLTLGKTIMGNQKNNAKFQIRISLQMPQIPVVYIRPDFKAELHSFF